MLEKCPLSIHFQSEIDIKYIHFIRSLLVSAEYILFFSFQPFVPFLAPTRPHFMKRRAGHFHSVSRPCYGDGGGNNRAGTRRFRHREQDVATGFIRNEGKPRRTLNSGFGGSSWDGGGRAGLDIPHAGGGDLDDLQQEQRRGEGRGRRGEMLARYDNFLRVAARAFSSLCPLVVEGRSHFSKYWRKHR